MYKLHQVTYNLIDSSYTVTDILDRVITDDHFKTYKNSTSFFKSLGGVEKWTNVNGSPTLTSISPDKQTKIVRTFNYVSDTEIM